MTLRLTCLALLSAFVGPVQRAPAEPSTDLPRPASSPVPAEESLRFFQIPDGCAISLAAAEPDVIDPVHIAFDEHYRMWVVEYSDYPNGPEASQPGLSRIRVLTDDNADGRYDKPVLFADKLLFATGVLPWRDGVIVTTAGSVLFLRDTDGNGRADDSQEWFTGFKQENPQLRANHPTLALDNHVYVASGLRVGEVVPGKDWAAAFHREDAAQPPEPVSLSGRDFRFDPLTGDYESVSGVGQFGLTFDDWGNRFVCSNRNPCKHIVLEDRYLRRNPRAAVPQVFEDVLPAGDAARLYPLTKTWTTSNLHINQFTAACGVCVYRGDALPDMAGDVFVCEPTANLVHRAVLEPSGSTFTSRVENEGTEFLASTDEWFRPVNLTAGPDGALYVVDMYRAVIEHPQFMPEELKRRPDLLLGNDRGRIYRVTGKTGLHLAYAQLRRPRILGVGRPVPLNDMEHFAGERRTPRELCALLEHSNAWHRDTAQRLILQARDDDVQEPLEMVFRRSPSARARLHALWLLLGRGELRPDILYDGLLDGDLHVQRAAVEIAGLTRSSDKRVYDQMRRLARQSSDGHLRLALALNLPNLQSTVRWRDLIFALDHRPADRWLFDAAATAPPEIVLETLLSRTPEDRTLHRPPNASPVELFDRLYAAVGVSASLEDLSELLQRPTTPANLPALAAGVRQRGDRFVDLLPKLSPEAAAVVQKWLQQGHATATNAALPRAEKLVAIGLLYHDSWEHSRHSLERIFRHERDPVIRAAAVDLLASFREQEIAPIILPTLANEPPEVRSAIVRAMISSVERIHLLLDEIESDRVSARLLDAATINRLTSSKDSRVRERSKQLFASLTPADRQKVMLHYQACLALKGDPQAGREVFQKNCTTCHRIGDLGVNVAPDISDSRSKTPDYLLTAILDPNRAIDNNFFSYTILDRQGQVHTGVIATETATSVTLNQPEGKTVTLLRDDIDEMKSSGMSLMPEGLERNIPPQQMADLISFIKNWRYLDGAVPQEVIR